MAVRFLAFVVAVVGVISATTPVAAHEDYQETVVTLKTPDGQPFEVVRHWTDGIVFYDPVKLILRKPDGELIAETSYCRDMVVIETSADGWLAFGSHPWNVFYHQAWRIGDGKLDRAGAFEFLPRAFLGSVQSHPLAYGTNVPLCVAAFAAWMSRRRNRTAWTRFSLFALACFCGAIVVVVAGVWMRGDLFTSAVVTVVVAMLASFLVHYVCRSRERALGCASSLATAWLGLLTLYFATPPFSILLITVVICAVAYLVIEYLARAPISPPSH